MHAATYDSIHAIDPALWDSAASGQPFLSWQWVAHGEAVIGKDAAYYILIFDGDQPIAGACLFIEHDIVLPYIGIPFIKHGLRSFLHRSPPIVCKTPEPVNRSGLFFQTSDASARQQALALILHEAQRLAHQIGASFVHFDYLDDDTLTLDWPGWQTLSGFMDSGTLLDLAPYDTFEAYQASVLNAKRRKNIRHDQQRAAAQGLTVHIEHDLPADVIPHLIGLIAQVNAVYDVDHYPHADHILRHLSTYQHACWLSVSDRAGAVVGTELLFYDPATRVAVPVLFGHDQAARDVYMILYYAEIQFAIETLKAHTLVGGSGKPGFKFRLGFQRDAHTGIAYYARSPILRGLAAVLNKLPIWQEDNADD